MRLALDAMGGDHAPGPIVAGAVQAVAADPELVVVLVGDETALKPLLPAAAPRDRLEIFHATQVVGMEESPVVAMRKKPDNTISRCWQLLAQKKVDGIVSAGNTGAMVAGGLMSRRFLANVQRPGIAATLPTLSGFCVMLDVGANVNPKPEHLYQYGVMGALFAHHILKKERPTIGLMNVGSEEAKGHDLAKDTHTLFNASALREQFIGNVEGRDLHDGTADVVVTDGFVGNVVLKTCEGTFDFSLKMTARELLPVLGAERARGEKALQELAERYHYSAFGGAPLLGIDGVCLICHGSSKERAIKNALAAAASYVRAGLNERIVQELAHAPARAGEG
jgi:glycerol-3-phosphate acyltransferase PlsX